MAKKNLTAAEIKSTIKIQKADVPVSVRALTFRLQRRLLKFGMQLEGGAHDGKVTVVWQEKGKWIRGESELETLARDTGALKPWERVTK